MNGPVPEESKAMEKERTMSKVAAGITVSVDGYITG
jgi:hypothetical protein